jgi:glycerol uptake facilitator-like aquaporin
MFGPVSGAHFNPAVSLVDGSFGGMSWRDVAAYIRAQVTSCITGAGPAAALICALYPDVTPAEAAEVIVAHTDEPHRGAHTRRTGEHAIEPA